MHPRPIAILCLSLVAAIAVAGTALGQSATINWKESFSSNAPENNPTINTGDSVTWNVVEGGHNVDVTGPEHFSSRSSGTDPKGTQFTHTFNTPGKYTYICDYHGNMHGTITVVQAPAPPTGGGTGGGGNTGGGSTGTGGSSGTGTGTQTGSSSQPAAGSTTAPTSGAAATSPAAAADAAAPQLARVSARNGTLRVRLSEPAKLTVRLRRVGSHRVGKHTISGRTGVNAIRLSRWMGHGRYHVSVLATDAAGNVSRPLRLALSR